MVVEKDTEILFFFFFAQKMEDLVDVRLVAATQGPHQDTVAIEVPPGAPPPCGRCCWRNKIILYNYIYIIYR